MYYNYRISDKLVELSKVVEKDISPIFAEIDDMTMLNSAKVLRALQEVGITYSDFVEVSGYGYEDMGRDKLEKVYAKIFGAEDALVRTQIMSGTHALNITFDGLLHHGDTMISITGIPYVSVQSIIGLSGDSKHSLINNGINYEQIELIDDDFDIPTIVSRLKQSKVRLVEIQRSRGYAQRKSLSIDKIERVISEIRKVDNDVIIMVDNCYGDLVEDREPTEVGADILVGSHMKNLGGGLCKTGGYIVGKKNLVSEIADRLSAPCVGKELGVNFNENMNFFKGLYLAPRTINSALKTMVFASAMLEKLGYEVSPRYDEHRTDIIQTIRLKSDKEMIEFCQGLQKGMPINSKNIVRPYIVPGYKDKEVSASGAFTKGATIELSADGPVCDPYTIYMQGSLSYEYGKLGVMIALNDITK